MVKNSNKKLKAFTMKKVPWNKRMSRKPYKQYERISALVGIIDGYKMISQELNV